MSEGSRFFEGQSAVQEALRKITERLNELRVPYAIAGGLALFRHGHRRFTEDVDILVTRQGLAAIHTHLEGLGFPKSKHLRDVDLGVKIEFLVTGDYPGDGKPKPVAFPDPSAVTVVHEGINYLNLPTLIELKLASGMTNMERMKDLADVLELIKLLALPRDFVQQLAPYVQDKFIELWTANRQVARRYVRIWRNKFLTVERKSVTHTVRDKGEIVVIDHVPAEVCSVCGDTLFAPETVRGLERLLARREAPARSAPVYDYDATEGRAA